MPKKINKKIYEDPMTFTDHGRLHRVELELENSEGSTIYLVRKKEDIYTRNQWGKIYFIDEGVVFCRDDVPVHYFKNLDHLRTYIKSMTGTELIIFSHLKSINP